MCDICFNAAQVVPLGALYARAKFVAVRERREAAAQASSVEVPSHGDGAVVLAATGDVAVAPEPAFANVPEPALAGRT